MTCWEEVIDRKLQELKIAVNESIEEPKHNNQYVCENFDDSTKRVCWGTVPLKSRDELYCKNFPNCDFEHRSPVGTGYRDRNDITSRSRSPISRRGQSSKASMIKQEEEAQEAVEAPEAAQILSAVIQLNHENGFLMKRITKNQTLITKYLTELELLEVI